MSFCTLYNGIFNKNNLRYFAVISRNTVGCHLKDKLRGEEFQVGYN